MKPHRPQDDADQILFGEARGGSGMPISALQARLALLPDRVTDESSWPDHIHKLSAEASDLYALLEGKANGFAKESFPDGVPKQLKRFPALWAQVQFLRSCFAPPSQLPQADTDWPYSADDELEHEAFTCMRLFAGKQKLMIAGDIRVDGIEPSQIWSRRWAQTDDFITMQFVLLDREEAQGHPPHFRADITKYGVTGHW